jgi:magnesium transporter
MIKTQLLTRDGFVKHGGAEQIAHWREDTDCYIWIDLENETPEDESALLISLDCHPLAIEDVQRFRHPPKTETFDGHTLILYRGITQFNPDLTIEQMSIAVFVSDRCVISCHPKQSMSIKYWRENAAQEKLLKSPALFATKIMHFSVGRYLDAILEFEPHLNELEDSMQERPNDDTMRELIAYQSLLRKLKRIFSYHERLATNLLKNIPEAWKEEDGDIEHALQDLFERCERLHGLCTMYYEICGDLINWYLSITSHSLNSTMRVLTVITAIFVPLTFIAGIYGMNFHNMPELNWEFGYFYVLGVMLIVAAGFGVVAYKKWLQ